MGGLHRNTFLNSPRLLDGALRLKAMPRLCFAGQITSLVLPTKGVMRWTYQKYELPAKGCDPVNLSSGVLTRTLADPLTQTPDATWSYAPVLSSEANTQWNCDPHLITFGPTPSEELRNTVTPPVGDQTIYYFSVWPLSIGMPPDAGFTFLEYGLPLSHKVPDSNGKYISTQICSGTCTTQSVKRTTYVRYERDYPYTRQFDANRRLAGSRTVFNDDSSNTADTDFSDFDGVGHYRTATQTGSFLGTGSSRTTSTAYNTSASGINSSDSSVIATGTYVPNGSGGSFVLPSAGAPWVIDLFTSKTIIEGTTSATQQFCFAPATGFLKGARVLASSGAANTDLVTGRLAKGRDRQRDSRKVLRRRCYAHHEHQRAVHDRHESGCDQSGPSRV